MNIDSSDHPLGDSLANPAIGWEVVTRMEHRATKLRAEAFARAFRTPWRWLRARIARARAPMDFAPIGTCP